MSYKYKKYTPQRQKKILHDFGLRCAEEFLTSVLINSHSTTTGVAVSAFKHVKRVFIFQKQKPPGLKNIIMGNMATLSDS